MKTRGFTIVELLIVIVVIAILAAITIVSYNGITIRAQNAAAMNALRNISQKYQAYIAEKGAQPSSSEFSQIVANATGEGITVSLYSLGGPGGVINQFCATYENDAQTIRYFANSTDRKNPTKGYCTGSNSGQYTVES